MECITEAGRLTLAPMSVLAEDAEGCNGAPPHVQGRPEREQLGESMRELYPPLEPFVQHSIEVGDGHVLHASEYGRPDGLPVVVLHGGPGAGSAAWHARVFDPDVYRVVLFDQRGCGRSTPHASLAANTTEHLLADIEQIRVHLGVDCWCLFGGSWGATLAVLYAARHPERVRGLFLRGVFLARARDIAWFYGDGARRFLPDAWEAFVAVLPPADRDQPLVGYHRRLFGTDDIARMAAARAWSGWEVRALRCGISSEGAATPSAYPGAVLALARIQAEYLLNACWLAEGEVLAAAENLAGLPGTIVHGRYDLVCPVEQAHALARAWPDATLEVVEGAGHGGAEPGVIDALVRTTDRFAAQQGQRR